MDHKLKKNLFVIIVLASAFAGEYFTAESFLAGIVPFPFGEMWMHTLDGFLRDALLFGAALLLYSRKDRIRDRAKRYEPVVVVGVSYLFFGCFIISFLEMDKGFLTLLAYFAGLFNNIVLVLLAAMYYHHWPTKPMKAVYFGIYYLTCLVMIFDAIYFWTTSMHVESVLFDNLNHYAFIGIVSTTAKWQVALVVGLIVLYAVLFRVSKPRRSKPNFTWSLLCVVLFGMGLNLSYNLLSMAVYQGLDQVAGLDIEVDMEKSRRPTRDMLAAPINVNFFGKAFFKTDKVVKNPQDFKERVLSEEDKKILKDLGIVPQPIYAKPGKAQYDRVVLLVLESVHREYIHFYNPKIPAGTTPFLDKLLTKAPHFSHYYSTGVPTTQGLNATFRSQVIYDEDLPGKLQGSLYRAAQAAGYKGIFLNASSRYYNKEYLEYPQQFGMEEYLARENLETQGYTGASGWGYHNDVMYKETLQLLDEYRNDKLLLVTKTLDMHQPYPYYGISYENMPPDVRDQGTITVCGMYWVDKTLENFFKEAKNRGLMDERTLFVITSDHNPHSGGEYKTLVTKEIDKRSVAPIPLIFVSSNALPLAALATEEYASQEDLAPTLLPLMGAVTPPDFMGRDLRLPTARSYALGYFGGKAYYYSEEEDIVAELNEALPDTPEKDALANYLMYHYTKRHRENS